MALKKGKAPLTEAKEVLEERLKNYDTTNGLLLKLRGRNEIYMSPKFTFETPSGAKVKVRYLKDENSIFVDEQNEEDYVVGALDGDVAERVKATLEKINIKGHRVVSGALLDFLALNKAWGLKYEPHDPKYLARVEEEKTEAFDEIWYQVRDKKSEDLKALYLLAVPGTTISQVNALSSAEMKMTLRNITKDSPEEMRGYLESRILRPLFLYNFGIEMGILRIDRTTNDIQWADSKKRICTVPVDADPAKFFAKLMLEDDFVAVRQKLEEEAK